MKKIFYKIFLAFLLCSYIPLLTIFMLNYWYTNNYIEVDRKNEMINIMENIKIENIKKQQFYDKEKGIYAKYIDLENQNEESTLFKLFNKLEVKADIREIPLEGYEVKQVKLSRITNHYYLIKRISNTEIIVIVTEIINPQIISKAMLNFYKTYSIIVIPLIFIVTYILSKKFAEPIETLEKISTKMTNQDFTDTIDIKAKDELSILAKNINKMANKLKSNNIELSELNNKLKIELMEKKKLLETEKNFMRALGHELKTPVAIINGYIEALQDGIIPEEEIDKTYQIMYNEGLSINKLIKDINDYLKLEFKNLEAVYEKINLKKLIENIIERYKLDIEQKNITLTMNCEELIIESDEKCLNIILNNLITNAITYVDERKIINIILKDGELRVENSSKEISEEILSKIFDPFYKGDTSRNRKYGGTGLGLSIVKNILEFLKLEYSFKYEKDSKNAVFLVKFL